MPSRDKLTSLTAPTLIRHAEVPYVVWGDEESHFVNDLFYVLSSQLVFVTVTLPPGGMFRSSDKFRAYFDTHECLYVLEGQYTCQDPETGEVRTARQGEMLFMPEKRWHYGYNFGTEALRLLECIAPPTNQAALAHVPRPSRIVPFNRASFADHPRKPGKVEANLNVCSTTTAVSAVIGNRNPVLFQVLASTERVSFSKAVLRPNSHSELLTLPYDTCYHGIEGLVHIQSPENGEYFAVGPSDVAFIPGGTAHRLFNHSAGTLPILLGGAGSFARIEAR